VGLYSVPLRPCSRGTYFAAKRKEEGIGGNRKKEAHKIYGKSIPGYSPGNKNLMFHKTLLNFVEN